MQRSKARKSSIARAAGKLAGASDGAARRSIYKEFTEYTG
jgi:hypothetical protein